MTNLSAHLNCVTLSRNADGFGGAGGGAAGCCGCFWLFAKVM